MRVTLVEPSSRGGQARYAADLARALAETSSRDDTVNLVVPRDFPYGSSGYNLDLALPPLRGLHKGGPAVNLLTLLWRRKRQVDVAVEVVRQSPPSVIHLLNTGLVSPRLLAAAAQNRAKLVATVHDLPRRVGRRVPRTRLLLRFWSRRLHGADLVIVHGDWSAEHLRTVYARRNLQIVVLPLPRFEYGGPSRPRDQLRRAMGLPLDVPLVLFFGSLRREKGLDVLLEALASDCASKLHLLVAGESPSRSEPSQEEYRALAVRRGVSGRVTWLEGYLPDDQVADVFACVDVVALPYRDTFAGQSAVLSLAASCDVPVVASAVGEMPVAIERHGLGVCVPPAAPVELASALVRSTSGGVTQKPGAHPWPTFKQIALQLWPIYQGLVNKVPGGGKGGMPG